MICDQFDVLYREGAKSGRVMAIALHPYLIGVPHRIGALDAALEIHLQTQEGLEDDRLGDCAALCRADWRRQDRSQRENARQEAR